MGTDTRSSINYIDWVDRVAKAHAAIATGLDNIVGLQEVLKELGLASPAEDAVWTALQDLDELGLVTIDSPHWVKPTQATRAIRDGANLRELWPGIVGQYLDAEQQTFLTAVVDASHKPGNDFADVDWISVDEPFEKLGWKREDHEPYSLTESLETLGLIRRSARLGGFISLHPTYRGMVRATKRASTEWEVRLDAFVSEWETVTVDFKREVRLGTPKLNAEFTRDVLALATTKASGRERYLIIGYDDQSRTFIAPMEAALTQERIEQVLDAYANRAPTVRLIGVDHPTGGGVVGILEITRDPAQLVYAMRKPGGKITAGEVFVRHGTHVVHPDPDELASLESEAEKARAAT